MEKSELLKTFLPNTLYFAFYSEDAALSCGYAVYKNKKSEEFVKITIITKDKNTSNYHWDDKKLIHRRN